MKWLRNVSTSVWLTLIIGIIFLAVVYIVFPTTVVR